MRLSNVAFVAALLPGLAAAQVYKIVGPDGKITYSDRPPMEAASANVQMIKSGGPVPVTDKAADIAAATVAPPMGAVRSPNDPRAGAKKAMRSDRGTSAGAPDDRARNELLKGLQVVLGHVALVEQANALCTAALPTSARKYDSAASGWRSRNGDVINRANSVLSLAFSGAERSVMEGIVRQKTDGLLAPVRNADAARRIKWCDNSAQELTSGTMDLARMAGVDALMRYQAP